MLPHMVSVLILNKVCQQPVGITVPPDGMVGCPGIGNEDPNEEYPVSEPDDEDPGFGAG